MYVCIPKEIPLKAFYEKISRTIKTLLCVHTKIYLTLCIQRMSEIFICTDEVFPQKNKKKTKCCLSIFLGSLDLFFPQKFRIFCYDFFFFILMSIGKSSIVAYNCTLMKETRFFSCTQQQKQ